MNKIKIYSKSTLTFTVKMRKITPFLDFPKGGIFFFSWGSQQVACSFFSNSRKGLAIYGELLTQSSSLFQTTAACPEDLFLLQGVLFSYPLDHIGSAGGYGKTTGEADKSTYQRAPDCFFYLFLADSTIFSHRFPLFTLLTNFAIANSCIGFGHKFSF
jgi:hypothetical protein